MSEGRERELFPVVTLRWHDLFHPFLFLCSSPGNFLIQWLSKPNSRDFTPKISPSKKSLPSLALALRCMPSLSWTLPLSLCLSLQGKLPWPASFCGVVPPLARRFLSDSRGWRLADSCAISPSFLLSLSLCYLDLLRGAVLWNTHQSGGNKKNVKRQGKKCFIKVYCSLIGSENRWWVSWFEVWERRKHCDWAPTTSCWVGLAWVYTPLMAPIFTCCHHLKGRVVWKKEKENQTKKNEESFIVNVNSSQWGWSLLSAHFTT